MTSIDVEDLRRLQLRPGETLLVTVRATIDAHKIARVQETIAAALPGIRTLVVPDNISFEVVAPAAETPEAFAAQLAGERA